VDWMNRIDTGEAMRHNNEVEAARRAEHLRRCEESPAYKRVYERWQQMMERMGREQCKVAQAMQQSIMSQKVSNIMGNCEKQTIHIGRPEPLPPQKELDQLAASSPLAIGFLALFFMSKEQLEQIPEDIKAMEEMAQVNAEYDSQIIRMSGFEW